MDNDSDPEPGLTLKSCRPPPPTTTTTTQQLLRVKEGPHTKTQRVKLTYNQSAGILENPSYFPTLLEFKMLMASSETFFKSKYIVYRNLPKKISTQSEMVNILVPQPTFTPKGQIFFNFQILSSSGPGPIPGPIPGPRSGPGPVQVRSQSGPDLDLDLDKRPGPGLTLNLVCHSPPPPENFS